MNNIPSKELVLYRLEGNTDQQVAVITLNRPESLNALSQALIAQLIDAINTAHHDGNVGAIVLTGAGKAFSAGVDLKEVSENPTVLVDDKAMLNAFSQLRKPLLGAINGYVMTGGLELALQCDLLYASEAAVFADTHAKVGLMPTWSLSQRLHRLVGVARAKEMSLSGRKIDAQLAERWGLVNRVFPADELMPAIIDLALEIAANDTVSVQGIRALIDHGNGLPIADALEYEYRISHAHNDKVDFAQMLAKLNAVRSAK